MRLASVEAEPGYEERDVQDVVAGVDWLVATADAGPERSSESNSAFE